MLSHRFLVVVAGLFVLCGFLACQPAQKQEPAPEPKPAEKQKLNTLTEAEKADGWKLLFNGKDFTGWRGFRMDEVSPEWKVEDGALYFYATHGEEGYGDLMTVDQYANFILDLDFKLSPGCNSGILFRVTENHEQEFMTGPEMQVIDGSKEFYPGDIITPLNSMGANYALHPASKEVPTPVGEWHNIRLVVDGAHVEHWLNGVKIVEYELWTDEWKDMVSKTKFAEWPDYGLNKTGHIVLQDHGKPVWYRNVKIKVL